MWSVVVRMCLIMGLAIFGNLFLVFVIYRGNAVRRQRISPVQLLLLHTCLADILFALLTLGSEIFILFSMPRFFAPDLVCRLVRYFQALPLYASPFLMVAISIDRYQAICRPLAHYRRDRFRRPNFLGLSAWLLALFCSFPQILIWHKIGLEEEARANMPSAYTECRTIYYGNVGIGQKQAYVLWFSTVAWLLPSVVSAVFYFKVCSTVWKSQFWNRCSDENLQRVSSPPASAVQRGGDFCPSSFRDSSNGCQRTRDYVEGLRKASTGYRNQMSEFDRKRIQTVRLTLTIVFCNFFLWLPFCATNVIQAFAPELVNAHRQLITYLVILGNLNACVNPWIYILFNRKILRRALVSVTKKRTESSSVSGTRQTSLHLRLTGNGLLQPIPHPHHQHINSLL